MFTSELEYNIDSGPLINDISDHLPIFAVCKCSKVNNISNSANIYDTRHINNENVIANLAYDCFLNNIYIYIYNIYMCVCFRKLITFVITL